MKHLFTLAALVFATCCFGQTSESYPFNPDSDADDFIGVNDILAVLSVFDSHSSVQTCMKGKIYDAATWYPSGGTGWTYEVPSDAGTIMCRRGGYGNIILSTEGYNEGDIIHIVCSWNDLEDGGVYVKANGVTVGFISYAAGTWPGGSTMAGYGVVFVDGMWSWLGVIDNNLSPTY